VASPPLHFCTNSCTHHFDTLQLERGKKLQEQLDASKRELTMARKQGNRTLFPEWALCLKIIARAQ
jgi:hypothetical protein